MKVTDKVIMDLLPLYFADEASEDTRNLVESYFDKNPEFASEMQRQSTKELPEDIPIILKPEDELIVLNKTKRLLRFRTIFLVIAIFCTALPFSFGDISSSDIEGVHWLWSKHPEVTAIAVIIGLICWICYFMIRNRLRTTAL